MCYLIANITDSKLTECSKICNLTVGDILDPNRCNTTHRNNGLPNLTEFRKEVRQSYQKLQKLRAIYPFEEYGTRMFTTFGVFWVPLYYFPCYNQKCN